MSSELQARQEGTRV